MDIRCATNDLTQGNSRRWQELVGCAAFPKSCLKTCLVSSFRTFTDTSRRCSNKPAFPKLPMFSVITYSAPICMFSKSAQRSLVEIHKTCKPSDSQTREIPTQVVSLFMYEYSFVTAPNTIRRWLMLASPSGETESLRILSHAYGR
jgi:hypothetical protein